MPSQQPKLKRITFTVINDLAYDQRMQRICSSLANAGYHITLIGRKLPGSLSFKNETYKQKRLPCFFSKGKLMYLEFNFRLLFYLLFISTDCYCAIDLDTIIPNYFASKLRKKKRVYDAHELFTELKEIVTRPAIQKLWLKVERFALPKYRNGYTVNEFIANEFKMKYRVQYEVIRNLPKLSRVQHLPDKADPFIIYQGAVNEGRSFETLIPAMKYVDARLVICGDGNFFKQTQQLIEDEGVEEKVEMKGMVAPEELRKLTPTAYAAVMLFEGTGLNQYQSLANRFFDYIMAGVPQVCVDYPQYKKLNEKYGIASLISNTQPNTIASALNNLLHDDVYYNTICNNCVLAREELNWQSEEKVLLDFYKRVFER
ncbi:MAG: glycosyltransferase family 4 protein [Segetibacter sp.]|nr:glycosyltransferase family 4 protein [Segetibacter sp.]